MAVSLTAVRRLVVGRQGFAGRFRRGDEADVEATIRRLTAVQLDSISTVDRAHRLTLGVAHRRFTRATRSPRLLGDGRIFEYWAHEASLLPIELWPALPHVMDGRRPLGLPRPRAARARRPRRARAGPHPRGGAARLARLRRAGRRRDVELEAGEDGARGALGQRPPRRSPDGAASSGCYDLAERVIPKHVPRVRRRRPRTRRCARSRCSRSRARGALTEAGDPRALAPEGRQGAAAAPPPRARRRRAAARGRGRRRRRAVLRPAGRRARRRRRRHRCSSARSTTSSGTGRCSSALFGFRHVIEVYKREHERAYGYYVLPLLAATASSAAPT